MDQEIEKISKKLMKELDEDRYRHTQGVMYTSAALAMRYGADLKKALLAGLLHDCAKCIPGHTKIKMCEKYNLEISEIERKNPSLLHAKLGAYLAKDKYDIEDEEILMAIRSHTTGRPGMSLFGCLINWHVLRFQIHQGISQNTIQTLINIFKCQMSHIHHIGQLFAPRLHIICNIYNLF